MAKTFIIDGNNIHDIPSFYEEINRVFMPEEDWKLGENLDALSDMLYGGYGEIEGNEEVYLIWKDFEKNRTDPGWALTRNDYRSKVSIRIQCPFYKAKISRTGKGHG